MYAARHAGHFGKNAKPVAGTSHPAMSLHRRMKLTGVSRVSHKGFLEVISQQPLCLTALPPEVVPRQVDSLLGQVVG
jgi:hypothetical protein